MRSRVGASMRRERSAMSTSKTFPLLAALLLCSSAAVAADMPKFGKPISEADASAWDISIGPDGVGLPAGSGTPAQGAMVFAAKCAACHGAKGEGGAGPRLVGGGGTRAPPSPSGRDGGPLLPYAAPGFYYLCRDMPLGLAQ